MSWACNLHCARDRRVTGDSYFQKRSIVLQAEKDLQQRVAAQEKQRAMAAAQIVAFKKAAEIKAKQAEADAGVCM